jgi:hypothetical protein
MAATSIETRYGALQQNRFYAPGFKGQAFFVRRNKNIDAINSIRK